MLLSASEAMRKSNPPMSSSGGKNCITYSLGYRQVVAPLNEDGDVERRIPVCLMTSGCHSGEQRYGKKPFYGSRF
ncbi:hypothetical protein EDD15DRAFT_2247950 [Pisolithus albus]|nr:hypothetical protein EDD15DRAFT_2247950 [Pisolithus albus]